MIINRHVHTSQHHHHQNHTHLTVNQQPNDAADAARLYGELEAKAAKAWEDRIVLPLDGINAQFAQVDVHRNVYNFTRDVRIAFKLNGDTVTTNVTLDDRETMNTRDRAIYQKIAEAITDSIMNKITMQTYMALNGGRL